MPFYHLPAIGRVTIAILAAGLLVVTECFPATEASAALTRGQHLLQQWGLQVQGVVLDGANQPGFNAATWHDSNFTTVNFSFNANQNVLPQLPQGTRWASWSDYAGPSSHFAGYYDSMVSFQYGDEWTDLFSNPNRLKDIRTTFDSVRLEYSNALVFTNMGIGGQIKNAADLAAYQSAAQPDMLCFDWYPSYSFSSSDRTTWYSAMAMYRKGGLKGNDGTYVNPIPYGQYLHLTRDCWTGPGSARPSESYVRLQQFASWAFGCKYTAAWVYSNPDPVTPTEGNSGNFPTMFSAPGTDANRTSTFDDVAETNRQSRNLGPALVELQSAGIFMKPGDGKSTADTGIAAWSARAGGSANYTDYLTGITPTRTQGGSPSGDWNDILIGYFKPMRADNSEYPFADGLHFMIVNGAAQGDADVGDPNSSAQWYRLTFDFSGSDFDALERLNRDTGLVEVITLTPISGQPHSYFYDLNLPGGTGDLFRFATAPEPGGVTLLCSGLIGIVAYVWRNRWRQ